MSNIKKRGWCFTLNNYNETDKIRLETQGNGIQYIVLGYETGSGGTPHIQGYLYYRNPVRLGTVKSFVGDRAHIEFAKGNSQQNRVYCTKEGNFFEMGELPNQGRRSDLDAAVTIIKNGGKGALKRVAEEEPTVFVKCHKGLTVLWNTLHLKERKDKTEVWWFYGKTGTGKSKKAKELAGDDFYYKQPGNKWWCGYKQQDVVVIDDFRDCKELCFSYWLRLFDRYPCLVEYKGGSVEFNSKKIIVTCSVRPQEEFSNHQGEEMEQMLRRIEKIEEFK